MPTAWFPGGTLTAASCPGYRPNPPVGVASLPAIASRAACSAPQTARAGEAVEAYLQSARCVRCGLGQRFVNMHVEDVDPVRARSAHPEAALGLPALHVTPRIIQQPPVGILGQGNRIEGAEGEDPGIGIPAPTQQRIVESFSPADVSNTRTHGGSGLGRAISRRMVATTGGVPTA